MRAKMRAGTIPERPSPSAPRRGPPNGALTPPGSGTDTVSPCRESANGTTGVQWGPGIRPGAWRSAFAWPPPRVGACSGGDDQADPEPEPGERAGRAGR